MLDKSNLELKIDNINDVTIAELFRNKNKIKDVTIKDLELKIQNIKNITIKNLKLQKKNLNDDTLRKLTYKLNVELPNKRDKLLKEIEKLKYQNSDLHIQNSKLVGEYVVHDYPVAPKKKLIVVVAFVTGLILSIFLVFFLNFISGARDKSDYEKV